MHRPNRMMVYVDALIHRFGNLIGKKLHISSIFHQQDVKLRPTAYLKETFTQYTGKQNITIPFPDKIAPIFDSEYLSTVTQPQDDIDLKSVPHLHLLSSPLKAIKNISTLANQNTSTRDTDMQILHYIKFYMNHWLSINNALESTL